MIWFFLRFYFYLFVLEIAQVEGGAEQEGQADSAESAEPDVGPDPKTLRS